MSTPDCLFLHHLFLYSFQFWNWEGAGFCSDFGCKPERFSSVIRKASIAKLLTSFSLEFSLFIDRSSSSGIQSQGFLLALRWQVMRLVAKSATMIGIRRPSRQIEHFGEIEHDA